eukprot:TRINITY_DN32450_c0_g1_i1.p1 TRINITY_DN32450_c0_g1~~TRINITY_DN32450_c0_g1_i1.p1  ORF type:complete len:455 (-),score=85.90 TRINITY_DN32450_c0_g1_i1:481-1845(-)
MPIHMPSHTGIPFTGQHFQATPWTCQQPYLKSTECLSALAAETAAAALAQFEACQAQLMLPTKMQQPVLSRPRLVPQCSQSDDCTDDCPTALSSFGEAASGSHSSDLQDHDAAAESEAPRTASASRRLRRKRAAERLAMTVNAQNGDSQPIAAGLVSKEQDISCCFKKLHAKLATGGRGMDEVLDICGPLTGRVWNLAQHPEGCRLVQSALELAPRKRAVELADELHGHVAEAVASPHANYLMQKLLVVLPFTDIRFVAEELVGCCVKMVRHRYGCRTLCRLIESAGSEPLVLQLVEEFMSDATELCSHCFAHHVIQSVIEHGHDQHKRQAVSALLSDPLGFAMHRNASYLLEKALVQCCPADQGSLVQALGSPETIADLSMNRCGCYVARQLLQRSDIDIKAALVLLRQRQDILGHSRHGRRLLQSVGLAPLDDDPAFAAPRWAEYEVRGEAQ